MRQHCGEEGYVGREVEDNEVGGREGEDKDEDEDGGCTTRIICSCVEKLHIIYWWKNKKQLILVIICRGVKLS